MKHINKLYAVNAYLHDTITSSKKLVKEFEVITSRDTQKFMNIEWVYMQVIVINLAKIFSSSKNEPFSLKQFKKYCTPEIRQIIEDLEKKNKVLLTQIKNNRDQLFVHTDDKFWKLRFSDNHVDQLERTFGTDFSRLRTVEKGNVRILPEDFKNNLAEVNEIISTLENVMERFSIDVIASIDMPKG